ncbi:L-histidine N(alpha)-methyltransferase [Granulicella rosea]|uniref:L-histidine N(alpha)-methyltransferase n=1 Tax=Granulicella rosea TaxID=474952 RepID=UPI001FE99EA9|nr:L-histidine N(alpha)-methyltransferase [Granulicella rosea]
MSSFTQEVTAVNAAVAHEAYTGLTASPKTLTPWLFYDEAGSHLFEQITVLPEYYLTRTERALFAAHADEILEAAGGVQPVTLAELGAGTATKTGILLAAAVRRQASVLYQPIDVSETSVEEARENIERNIPGVVVEPQVANYITEPIRIERPHDARVLALYIGSSIGNFAPDEAVAILRNLRGQLQVGDSLLLGTDLAPGGTHNGGKSVASLLAAYDDAQGVTAAFNRNVLVRLNRELGTNFDLDRFRHRARWNPLASRIEMHLESVGPQTVTLPAGAETPAVPMRFAAGETIHTENSYKFTPAMIAAMLKPACFATSRTFMDAQNLFAVTLATAV